MKKSISIMLLCVLTCAFTAQAGTRLLPTQASGGHIYIVAVGVADYPGTINDLNFCDADARSIAQVYANSAHATARLVLNQRATINNILANIRDLFSKATDRDVIILFFSGHGQKGAFCAYDGNLKYERIYAIMKRSKAKTKCIFADACYAGKARTNTAQRQQSAKNIMLFLSSRTNETSLETPGLKHGLFAYYLEKAMRGEADSNHDRAISAVELFNYVSKNVADYARDRAGGHQQHPVMWGNFPKNMVVLRY